MIFRAIFGILERQKQTSNKLHNSQTSLGKVENLRVCGKIQENSKGKKSKCLCKGRRRTSVLTWCLPTCNFNFARVPEYFQKNSTSVYQRKCMAINQKIPVYKSVSMNKTKFFYNIIVPCVPFLLLAKFIKNYL